MKQHQTKRCGICGKKLKKFARTSEYPSACWPCMILNRDSCDLFVTFRIDGGLSNK